MPKQASRYYGSIRQRWAVLKCSLDSRLNSQLDFHMNEQELIMRTSFELYIFIDSELKRFFP